MSQYNLQTCDELPGIPKTLLETEARPTFSNVDNLSDSSLSL